MPCRIYDAARSAPTEKQLPLNGDLHRCLSSPGCALTTLWICPSLGQTLPLRADQYDLPAKKPFSYCHNTLATDSVSFGLSTPFHFNVSAADCALRLMIPKPYTPSD